MHGHRIAGKAFGVLVVVALSAVGMVAPARAETVSYPVHLAWTWYDFDAAQVPAPASGDRGFYNMDSEITVEASDPDTAMYFARLFDFVGAGDLGGGYLGLQSQGIVGGEVVPKSLIFSIWDAAGARPAGDGGSTCNAFGHEGAGYSCQREFDWEVGRTYVMRIWETSPGWWGAWLIDVEAETEVQIGEINIADQRERLNAQAWYFTETFGVGEFSCGDLPHARVRWGAPRADNGTVHPSRGPNTFGVSNDDFPGASGCLDVARGWNEGGTAFHDVGLAQHPGDVMAEGVTYLYRVALDRSPTGAERSDGVARLTPDCVDGYRGLVRDVLRSAEFEQAHAAATADERVHVLYKSALHRTATPAERQNAAGASWSTIVEDVVTSSEFDERTGVLCASRRAPGPVALDRLSGGNRIATAVAISADEFPDGADTVYLARADVFADALAAGSLTDGPVLLVPSCGAVPDLVRAAVSELDPARVIALGGTAAVCDAMLTGVADGRPADRLGGRTRTATAAAIAQRSFPDGADEVYLASAADSAPDAVAGGTLMGGPILLTGPGGPDASTMDEIARLDPGRVVALGGVAAVSDEALAAAAQHRTPVRVAGRSRIETAVAISAYGFAPVSPEASSAAAGHATTVFLARADVFADAVAGGALTGGPILLVPSCGSLPSPVAERIADISPDRIVALGGTAAVCDALLEAAGDQVVR